MQELLDAVEQNVKEEKARADAKYGPIRSAAEGYGVLSEELMELDDEKIEPYRIEHVLRCIQMDRLTLRDTSRFDRDACVMAELREIRSHAVHSAAEAMQVAAVCDRFTEFVNGVK